MTAPHPAGTAVAYLLKRFPRLSETFILHEILELERQGQDLRLFSIMNPCEGVVHADVCQVRAPVTYLPAGLGDVVPLLRAHLTLLRRDPQRYAGIVAYILQRRRHSSTIKHFVRAGWLALELEKTGVTHLHAHFAHGPASVAHFVKLLTGLPYSFTAHAKDIYTSPPDLLAVKIRAARFVVTCTGYNVEHLTELVGGQAAARIHRIYHGLDLRKFSPDGASPHGQDGGAALILAVGRLVEKKGFPNLIEAVRLLTTRGYDVRLRIIGGGEMKDALRRQIGEAGLEDRVDLLGARPQEELIGLYREATLFALPSIVAESGDRDGIPNVLVEAMRLGLPVVSTTVSGIPELVVDGETGLLVPPRDAQALASALARLLDDAALRARLIAGASCHVANDFDLVANTTRLRTLLREATG
jgi:glycosyltransferase involved in cell wall biosynthesis